MKRAAAVAAAILLICLLGMINIVIIRSKSKSEAADVDQSMFVLIEKGEHWYVYYHRETKVMYVMSFSSYNRGNFTIMVNPDGSPMLYENTKED